MKKLIILLSLVSSFTACISQTELSRDILKAKQKVEILPGGTLKIDGVSIDGISTDPTLATPEATKVPSELAVKSALDSAYAHLLDSLLILHAIIDALEDKSIYNTSEIIQNGIRAEVDAGGNFGFDYSGGNDAVSINDATGTTAINSKDGSAQAKMNSTEARIIGNDVALQARGSGYVKVDGTTDHGGGFDISEDVDNGVNKVRLKVPDNLSANYALDIPGKNGTIATTGDIQNIGNTNLTIDNVYRTLLLNGYAGLRLNYDNAAYAFNIDADPDASTVGLKTYNGGAYLNLHETGSFGVDFYSGLPTRFRGSNFEYIGAGNADFDLGGGITVKNLTDGNAAPYIDLFEADNLANDSKVRLRTATANTAGAGYTYYFPATAPATDQIQVFSPTGSVFQDMPAPGGDRYSKRATQVSIFEDFIGGTENTWTSTLSSVTLASFADTTAYGTMRLSCSASVAYTGYFSLGTSQTTTPSYPITRNANYEFEARLKHDQATNPISQGYHYFGTVGGSNTISYPNNGIFFYFIDGGTVVTVQGGTRNGTTQTLTAGTNVTSAAYHVYKCVYTHSTGTAQFFVDGVSIGSLTATMPLTTSQMRLEFGVYTPIGQGGGAARTMTIDYASYLRAVTR